MKIYILITITAMIFLGSCQCPNPHEPIPPDQNPSLSGDWQAQGNFRGIDFLVQMNIMQGSDSLASGNGKLTALGQGVDFFVEGKNVYPNVSLVFFNFSDTLLWRGAFIKSDSLGNSNRISGLLQAPTLGLADYPLTFFRIANFYFCKCSILENQKTLLEIFGL